MKFLSIFACAIIAASFADAAETNALAVAAPVNDETAISPTEALEAAKTSTLPDGIALTGEVEELNEPATTSTDDQTEAAASLETHFEHGWGGRERGYGFGYGRFGGGYYGGFGKHRFGFSCSGIRGWAYPVGYWNRFGAGLYGGGCGLGLAAGGLFYC